MEPTTVQPVAPPTPTEATKPRGPTIGNIDRPTHAAILRSPRDLDPRYLLVLEKPSVMCGSSDSRYILASLVMACWVASEAQRNVSRTSCKR
ncbi:hypothetical protein KCU84_g43, partial [Aureobasidium melanogenum]